MAAKDDVAKAELDFVTKAEAVKMAEDAAALAVQTVMARFGDRPTAGTDMEAFVQGLAKAIAEVGNQGTGKQVIDPAVLTKRAAAKDKMLEEIIRARRAGVVPKYTLTATCHLANQLVKPVWVDNQHIEHMTSIRWDGVPNLSMLPSAPENEGEGAACEAARGIFDAFCEWIGKAPGTVARIMPWGAHGNMASPKGNMLEALAPIPRDYTGEGSLQIEAGALGAREVPPTGLEVIGGASSGHQRKTVSIPVLGTIARPATQQVA